MLSLSGHPYTSIPRGQIRGGESRIDLTMNDHEGEGSLNDLVVSWTEMYFASDQKSFARIANVYYGPGNRKFSVKIVARYFDWLLKETTNQNSYTMSYRALE